MIRSRLSDRRTPSMSPGAAWRHLRLRPHHPSRLLPPRLPQRRHPLPPNRRHQHLLSAQRKPPAILVLRPPRHQSLTAVGNATTAIRLLLVAHRAVLLSAFFSALPL